MTNYVVWTTNVKSPEKLLCIFCRQQNAKQFVSF
jgi:hypothetical protein